MRRFVKKLRRLGTVSLCLLLSVWISCDPWQIHRSVAFAQQKADLEAERREQLEKLADRLERLFDALEEAQQEIPRDTWDPEVIIHGQPEAGIEGIGTDAEAIFEWVRDNTYLVPYRGALRGHKGVLMDRLGNSLDRALLLAKLLRIAGHDRLRLMRAKLSEERARDILNNARPLPDEGAVPQREPAEDLAQQMQRYAEKYDLDAAELKASLDRMNLKSQRLAIEAVQRTHEQSQALMRLLEEKIEIPDADAQRKQLREDAVSDYQHHWWLEYGDGSQWSALDPTLPDAEPDRPVAAGAQATTILTTEQLDGIKEELKGTASQQSMEDATKDLVLDIDAAVTSQVGGDLQFEDALPWKYKHRLGIRVKIERWNDGQLEQLPVLEATLSPMALTGKRIALQHAPADWPTGILKRLATAEAPTTQLMQTVLHQHEWVPMLTIGDYRITNLSFTDAGQLNDPNLSFGKIASAAQLGDALQAMETVSDPIGSGRIPGTKIGLARSGRASPDTPSEPVDQPVEDAVLTAEWIEYVRFEPGTGPTKTERQIFDLLGPSDRELLTDGRDAEFPAAAIDRVARINRGLVLLGETAALPAPCAPSVNYVLYLTLEQLQANRDPFLKSIAPTVSADTAYELPQLARMPLLLNTLAACRQRWSSAPSSTYINHLQLANLHQQLRWSRATERLVFNRSFDIVWNQVAVSPNYSSAPFRVRLIQGVLDTNAEALVLGQQRHRTRNTVGDNAAVNFWNSTAEGSTWTVLDSSDEQDVEAMAIPADAQRRIVSQLREGYAVVVPEHASHDHESVAWWRLDPKSGAVLGIGQSGWGAVSVEEAAVVSVLVIATVALICWAFHFYDPDAGPETNDEILNCIGCLAIGVGITVFGALSGGYVAAGAGITLAATCALKGPAERILREGPRSTSSGD